jgi:hypothetical protein
VANRYIFPYFGILRQEKAGNHGLRQHVFLFFFPKKQRTLRIMTIIILMFTVCHVPKVSEPFSHDMTAVLAFLQQP